MVWGFEKDQPYNRKTDIHGQFGGQRQSGIITPKQHNVIFVMADEHGHTYGYGDRFLGDRKVEYFGEGLTGDMTMTHGNKAIADHAINGKDILLFRKERPTRVLRFFDQMVCEGWHWETAPDSAGNMRQAIVFELRPLDMVADAVETQPITYGATNAAADTLAKLRALAMAAAAPSKPGGTSVRTIYERSADVRNYVLARAKSVCEGCNNPAPFLRKDGTGYLEPHHIRRVSDGGPDDPRFVIALCPNCHRRVHAGVDGPTFNKKLLGMMKAIEASAN